MKALQLVERDLGLVEFTAFWRDLTYHTLLARMRSARLDIILDFDDGEPIIVEDFNPNRVEDMHLLMIHRHFCDRVTKMQRQTIARKAAKAKAERHQASDPHAWTIPYFERAYAALEADGYAQIGRRKLSHYARQLARQAGIETSRRRDISERRAEAFLKQRENELI